MSNLTRAKSLAFEAPDFRQVPGCDLMIYKRLGAGLRFLELVPAGKDFKPSLLQAHSSLVAFAVSRDPNWDHEFSRALKHVEGVSTFTLHCVVTFQVGEPKRLIELLERDPLLRIEKKAVEIFGSTASRLPWQIIADDEEEMRAETLSIPNLERFKAFASDYGIMIDGVALDRTLWEKDLVKPLVNKEREDARLRHEQTREELDRAEELRARARHEKFVDTSLERAIEVLQRASNQVGSFEEVEAAIAKLVAIRSQVRIALGGSSLAALAPQIGQAGLLGAGAPRQGLAELMVRLGQVFAELAPGPAARSLGGAALHLVAQILEDSDQDRLEDYRAALKASFSTLLRSLTLTPEASQLFRHLQDIEAVRRELAGAEAQ